MKGSADGRITVRGVPQDHIEWLTRMARARRKLGERGASPCKLIREAITEYISRRSNGK